jgi:hypothetical protein
MYNADPKYPSDPVIQHCNGENCEDKSDDSEEYCFGDSDHCKCNCDDCKQVIQYEKVYENYLASQELEWESEKDRYFDEDY